MFTMRKQLSINFEHPSQTIEERKWFDDNPIYNGKMAKHQFLVNLKGIAGNREFCLTILFKTKENDSTSILRNLNGITGYHGFPIFILHPINQQDWSSRTHQTLLVGSQISFLK